MVDELSLPRKSVELEDPGAHTLDSSDESSDQFTDASEGRKRAPSAASDRSAKSPIPITRVERLDDEPAYGEVPGTDAYKKRAQDAVPDEVEVITRSRSQSRVNPGDRPTTPLELPIPKIIAMKIDPDIPAYGDVPGTDAYDKRRADAVPDMVIKSPDADKPPENPWRGDVSTGSPTTSLYRSPAQGHSRTHSGTLDDPSADASDERDDGEFGDDFDDFEEGQEGGDDDFGDFDEGFQEGEGGESLEEVPSSLPAVSSLPHIPSLDWSEIDDIDDLQDAMEPYLAKLFPNSELASQLQAPTPPPQSFLSDRSLSLYQQLVAPPPLAPPNWLRSRIRRLFLVSLGVPVDLDEILPASKQKKLILPSINFPDRSPRPSTDSRSTNAGAISRLKGQNDSNFSVDSSGNVKRSTSNRRRLRDESEPGFDVAEALRVAGTMEVKLKGMSDEELKSHVQRLEQLGARARESLGYWERRKEGAVKEKEAFEGVIENLVKHAKKVRR